MKIPYFCCIGAELKRYEKDFDFMNQVYLYKVPTDDTMEEVLAQDYFQAVADTVLQDDIVYIYEPTTEMLYTCHFNKQNGHITAEQMSNNIPSLTPGKILISDATGHITAGDVSLDFVKNKLTDLENDKVNIDGSSTMTGPLKFKAGSFSGAIAGGLGDGISIYKLKADGSIDSEVASLTKTNGFTPGTTNAQNIGSPTLKWKDAHVARVIAAVLNNGYDIAVPVTNGPDTLALKSEVDTAANSGRMITDQGVWYAKMYSASTVPTGAEYDGTNYADFSQTDGDGNPVIKIYTGASGAWTLTDTITPPAEYDGYVPITSKIWDIVEQTNQQGGRILWNHQSKEFTPYPNIVDLSKVATTDMDNLTSTGQNIANWSSNVTNCITGVYNKLNIVLSDDGTLTLKAGSEVLVPNGFEADGTTPKYDTVVITSDLSTTSTANTNLVLLYKKDSNDIVVWSSGALSSGTTAPSGTSTFYNTALNKIRRYSSRSLTNDNLSLPLAYVAANSTKITTIYHIVNTIGYIGSELFSMPGVSGLIPDGFNTDGSLKNIAFTTTGVARTTVSGTGIIHTRLNATEVTGGDLIYNRNDNCNYIRSFIQENERKSAIVGFVKVDNNIITGLRTNTVAHIIEYNNTDYIAHQAMPSSNSITLTTAASGNNYQAPADGYFRVSGVASAAGQRLNVDCGQVGFQGFSYVSGQEVKFSCPVKKGGQMYLSYNMPQANVVVRFIYIVGAVV